MIPEPGFQKPSPYYNSCEKHVPSFSAEKKTDLGGSGSKEVINFLVDVNRAS
jgi:hypothetical protein